MYKIKSQAKNTSIRKKVLLGLLGLAVVAVTLTILELCGLTHFVRKRPVPATIPTINTPDKSSPSPNSSSNEAAPAVTNDKDGGPSSSPTSSTNADTQTLVSPYGEFVSNHHPGENGSPTKENSVCKTTPGATCYIKFTNGSTSTALPAETATSEGIVSWNWDIKEANLTKGDWKIEAIATLNGQTKSTQDPLPLTIQ